MTSFDNGVDRIQGRTRSFKKNQKLETFLQKFFDSESFEKLRCYETAIVDGAKGANKVFKV